MTADRFAALYTGALTDVLYELGYGAQTLPQTIKPIVPGQRVAGPAFPVRWRPYVPGGEHEELAWQMMDAAPPGSVLVGAANATDRAALGDLALAYMKSRGVAGVVMHGGLRDIDFNVQIGLPSFCSFTTPQDLSHGRGSVAGWGEPITIGEVRVAPGDYVVGDTDGVVIIPSDLVEEVLTRTERLAARETAIRAALLAGTAPEQAFADNP